MHKNWRNKNSGPFKEEEHWKTLEKTSDMLIAGFQDDIKLKKTATLPIPPNQYFIDCYKPSLKYWSSHRSTLPVFKKQVINVALPQTNNADLEEDEQFRDILIIGPFNSGKSQLIKCFSDDHSKITDSFYKLPKTLNAEDCQIKFQKRPLEIMEVNWSFLKGIKNYYEDSKILFFICDVSDRASYSSILLVLMELIKGFDRPIALIFNKIDKLDYDLGENCDFL
jgi:predicted GTPase